MSNFNQDDSLADGQPGQESSPTVRKKLSSDELIALFLAFTGIGSILFWTLRPASLPVTGLNNGVQTMTTASENSKAETGISLNNQELSKGQADRTPTTASKEEKRATTPTLPVNPDQQDQSQSPNPGEEATSAKTEAEKTGNPVDAKLPVAAGVIAKISDAKPENKPQGTLEKPGKPKNLTDVPDGFWAKPAIEALSSRGVIDGFKDGTFKPNEPITRAQFAGMIQKAFDKPAVKDVLKFSDIKPDYWGTAAIEEATRTGFMNGYPGGTFKPDQSIPKLEMLSALATGLNLKPQGDPIQALTKYNDLEDIPKWALPKISSAVEAGIVLPDVTQLEPKKVATRADAASYIYQSLIKEGKIKP